MPHGQTGIRTETAGRRSAKIGQVILLVVHTLPETSGNEEIGRIISARKATSNERGIYEEGHF